jgi:ABC-type transport system involved in cytochrome c biogenesis permease subunit
LQQFNPNDAMSFFEKSNPKILLFTAILFILAGGLCTYFTARSVHVHLREGETNTANNSSVYEDFRDSVANFSNRFANTPENSTSTELPFKIRLDEFDVDYYEGTHTIKDYISYVTVTDDRQETKARISMNKIMRYRHYRIFQEDYDQDLNGSVLLVRYDPWGTALVYIGFALLLLSMIWLLLRRDGVFRRLLRALSLAALLIPTTQATAQGSGVRGQGSVISDQGAVISDQGAGDSDQGSETKIQNSKFKIQNLDSNNFQFSTFSFQLNQEEAEAFGRLSVYYRGRIAPFDSYARDYCKAAFPKGSMPDGYTPVQLVTEIYLFPEKWPDRPKPVMKIFPQQSLWLAPEDNLSQAQNSDTLFIAHVLDFLKQSIQEENHQQNLQIINSIATFQEKRCTAGSVNRQKEQIEILYNQVRPERKIFLIEIIFSLILLVFFITAYDSIWAKRCSLVFLLLSLVLLTADIGLRCYLSGHNPFSGLFDTLLLVSAGMLIISLVISPKNKFIALPTLIASAFITLVATMMGGSSFSPLMPVLISPWLTIHVTIIMTAYCFLTFTFVLAIISIFLIIFQNKKYKKLKIKYLSQLFCILGVVFLAIGIMIGALWANISWGQYWSWDPKETWALITLLGYCIALPGVIPATRKHDWLYHLIVIVAFLLLLTTYFGVNFWMGGMHAYN